MVNQITSTQESHTELPYLPDTFTDQERQQVAQLAALASRHVEHDPDSTVTPKMLHKVAELLVEGACDARTIMIFFMSLLDEDELAPIANQFDADMRDAAHSLALIRLLSRGEKPKQIPIRKVLLRQLVLKVTHDVRVFMIKIAGRLVLLREAATWQQEERELLARECLDVVVPWCDALGLEAWRQELQELSFKYLNPEQYNFVLDLMGDHRDVLFEVKDQVIHEIRDLAKRHKIEASIRGRVKTHYAVFRKMRAYELSYDEVWDRIGIRILCNTVFDCYYIQTAIEEELYTERRRYVDYIETPRKPYNYQSLHLTVMGPRDIAVEIQIRTYDMHIKGEFGVAAHWKMYGGGEGANSSEDMKFAFLRTQASQLLGDPMDYLGNTLDTLLFNNSILPTDTAGYVLDAVTGERVKDSQGNEIYYRDATTNNKGYIIDPHNSELICSQNGEPIWYQSEILPDRVLVYTPDGDLKSLPQGSTPLDFAYYVHENVGHTCVGAKINGKMQKLDYVLKLGDRVEILTRKGHKPSLDWLYNGYSNTRRAHDKIKRFFREKTDDVVPEVEELGLAIIKKRLSAHKIRDLSLDKLAQMLHCANQSDMLEAVGSAEINVMALDETLGNYILDQLSENNPMRDTTASTIAVSDKEFDLLYTQANCCLPVPGDDTISYISQGKGFTLHRADCRNVSTLDPARVQYFDFPKHLMCEDGNKPAPRFLSRMAMTVVNPSRTILYIKEIASVENLPIESLTKTEDKQLGSRITLVFRTACKSQVDRLIQKLNANNDILMIRRARG